MWETPLLRIRSYKDSSQEEEHSRRAARRTQNFHNAKKSTSQEQVEDFSGRSHGDWLWKKNKRKYNSGRHHLMALLFLIQCQLTVLN